jgi:hypothetical protein
MLSRTNAEHRPCCCRHSGQREADLRSCAGSTLSPCGRARVRVASITFPDIGAHPPALMLRSHAVASRSTRASPARTGASFETPLSRLLRMRSQIGVSLRDAGTPTLDPPRCSERTDARGRKATRATLVRDHRLPSRDPASGAWPRWACLGPCGFSALWSGEALRFPPKSHSGQIDRPSTTVHSNNKTKPHGKEECKPKIAQGALPS